MFTAPLARSRLVRFIPWAFSVSEVKLFNFFRLGIYSYTLHHISGSIGKLKTIPIGTMYIKAFWDLLNILRF